MFVSIDTVKFSVKKISDQKVGRKTRATLLTPDGEILAEYENRVKLEGKSRHNLTVRTITKKGETWLTIEGSLYGHFLGQNIVTGSNLKTVCLKALGKVLEKFKLKVSDQERSAWCDGDIRLERVDMNISFPFEPKVTTSLLKQISRQMVELTGDRQLNGNYVRWRQSREHRELVWYDKGLELMYSKKLGESDKATLRSGCEGMLRFEVRYRKASLRKQKLQQLSAWDEGTPLRLMEQELKTLDFAVRIPSNIGAAGLSNRAKATFAYYKQGVDLKEVLPKSTYHKHKNEILDACAIDIRVPHAKDEIFLGQYLTPEQAIQDVPEWLSALGLYKKLKLKIRCKVKKLMKM